MTDLRHRLEVAASSIEPDPDLWTSVEHRLAERRRRPMAVVAIAAAAAVVAAVLITPRLDRHSASVRVPAGEGPAAGWRALPPAPLNLRACCWQSVWTGSELLLSDFEARMAAYHPDSNTWTATPPSPLGDRSNGSVVWTGSQLFVWGGMGGPGHEVNGSATDAADGATYDPIVDKWTVLPPSPLSARSQAIAVWTGSEVLVVGGGAGGPVSDGAAYDPAKRTWRKLSGGIPSGILSSRSAAVWTGQELLLADAEGSVNTAAYNPTTDRWRVLAPSPAVASMPVGVWTGRELLLWGDGAGAAFDPASNRWVPFTTLFNDSSMDVDRRVAWTGDEMVLRSDGRLLAYDPNTHSSRLLPPGGPTEKFTQAMAWTGDELLVWSSNGGGSLGRGWAYRPLGRSVAASTSTAPPTCPTAAEVAARANTKPRVVVTTAAADPAQGQHLEPPPQDAAPKITADQAWASARNYMAPDPGPDPTITLATFTSSMTGTHLAWVLVFRNALVIGPLGGPAPMPGAPQTTRVEPPCYLGTTVQPVDATNGIAMGMAQGAERVRRRSARELLVH